VATQTEPPKPAAVEPGPQWITFGVPVAEGAVISQFVLFKPSLYTVTVDRRDDACEPWKHEPGVEGGLGKTSGQLNVAVAV
jgi:hypothetical protein